MKQTLEEAKQKYIEKHVSRNEYASFGEAFIAGAEWQAEQSPWISVKERLPEEEKGYFVMVENSFPKNTNVVIGEFYSDNNKFYDEATDCVINDAIAWMPIPSFDEIIEANKDVLERIKEKGN